MNKKKKVKEAEDVVRGWDLADYEFYTPEFLSKSFKNQHGIPPSSLTALELVQWYKVQAVNLKEYKSAANYRKIEVKMRNQEEEAYKDNINGDHCMECGASENRVTLFTMYKSDGIVPYGMKCGGCIKEEREKKNAISETKREKKNAISEIKKSDKYIIISLSTENGKEMMNRVFCNLKDHEIIGLLEITKMNIRARNFDKES